MTLYITEKPSQIEPLRNALNAVGIKNNFEIVPLAGHILQLLNFKEYDKSMDDSWLNLVKSKKIPFFPKELKKRVKDKSTFKANGKTITSDYKKKFNEIKTKIDKADKIVIATDPDNEGATLGLEVIEKAKALSKIIGMINMSKLDLTSLKKEVKVLNKLPYDKMYQAGDARAYFDQMFGFNTSIVATVALGKGRTLQIGGVKLPTIRMVVERDLAFEKHKEIPFYQVKAIGKKDNSSFEIDIYTEDAEKKKYDNENRAKEVATIARDLAYGTITNYSEKNKTTPPPKPYSLTDLQSEANKRYKLSADETLKIAQKLYADYRVQSYPRTDCNYYAEGEYEQVSDLLKKLSEINDFNTLIKNIKNIDNPLKRKIFDDSKIEAHTALSPTLEISATSFKKLNDIEKKIFTLVANRYIIQFLDDYKYLEIKVNGKIDEDILFDFTQNETKNIGWRVVENFNPVKRTAPILSKGDGIKIESVKITRGTTKPKPRFTEATLLKAMEKIHRFFDDEEIKKQLGEKGIGTPATRASILNDLKTSRKGDEPYFKVDKKGTITSTQKARYLIDILPKDVSSPILRADMEAKLKNILEGKLTKEDYYKETQKTINNIINMILGLGEIPESSTTNKGETIDLKCPLCGADIVENQMLFKCSKQKYQNGKQSGCKFTVFKNNKILGRSLTKDDLKILLGGDTLENDRAVFKLDTSNKYFIVAEFKDNNNSKNSKNNNNELIETEKTYRYNNKFCFKNFFGKKLTKVEATKLLKGEKITVKLKSKAGKPYSKIVWLKDDNSGGFESDFIK